MAQQTINVGTAPNDGTGTPLRTAFQYTNSNFSELYTAVGPSGNNIVVPGSATITGDLTVDTSTLKVDSANNRVGVNKAAPAVDLDVGGSARFQSAGSNWMEFGVNVLTSNQSTGASIRSVVSSAGNPTYSWTGDSDTGLFNDVANSIGFAIGGSEAMRLNSTGLGVGITPAAGDGSGVFKAAGTGSGAANTRMGLDVREITSGNAAGIWLGAMTTENTGVIGSRTASGNIAFQTFNGASWGERMRIDYLGNVGIGVTPSAWGTFKALQIGTVGVFAGSSDSTLVGNNVYYNVINRYIANGPATQVGQYNGAFAWYNAPSGTAGNAITFTQAMTLDASGNLLVGTTSLASNEKLSVVTGNTAGAMVKNTGGATYTPLYVWNATTTGDGYFSAFFTEAAATFRGSITYNRTAGQVSYNITSDYRLKDDVRPIVGALSRVSSLKPSTYKLKETGFTCEGFIAHELAEVIPAAVTGEKDAVNEDGSIKAQQVDLSKVVPILVAAIQELAARVQTLETR